MKTIRPNRYAVAFDGVTPIEKRVVTLEDGTICFAPSMTAARRDLLQFVREWRQKERGRTARKMNDDRTVYYLKYCRTHGAGTLRVIPLPETVA